MKGHLNALQEEALQWLIGDEIEASIALERERMKYTILAGNMHLWQELYAEDEEDEENIEWFTPSSAEEVESVLAMLNSINQGAEDFTDERD